MAFNASGDYENPLRSANVNSERIDQGVDFGGSGPIFALGPGKITQIHSSGWPGGAFIVEQMTSGDLQGRFIYDAEDITPTVHVGQTVDKNTKVGDIHGQIEIGFASGANTSESMARQAGQASATGDPGEVSTGWGEAYNEVLKALGDKGGIAQGSIHGTVPNLGNLKGANPGTSPGGGGGSGSPLDISNIGSDLIDGLLKMFGLSSASDFLERAGLVILGLILVLVGLWKIADPNGTKTKKAVGTAKKAAVDVAVAPK